MLCIVISFQPTATVFLAIHPASVVLPVPKPKSVVRSASPAPKPPASSQSLVLSNLVHVVVVKSTIDGGLVIGLTSIFFISDPDPVTPFNFNFKTTFAIFRFLSVIGAPLAVVLG